jgi:hypothetical protein
VGEARNKSAGMLSVFKMCGCLREKRFIDFPAQEKHDLHVFAC